MVWEAEMIKGKDKSVTLTVKSAKAPKPFCKRVRGELGKKKKSVSSTFLTAINAEKVWVRLTKKFNLKPSSKKKMDWPIWKGLRRNITVYASSPTVGLSSSSPGSSKNYMIWKESTSIGP